MLLSTEPGTIVVQIELIDDWFIVYDTKLAVLADH
jgi:hypothetical protein